MSERKTEGINSATSGKVFSRRGFLTAGGAGLALLAAGCGGEQSNQEESSQGGKSGLVPREDIRIEFVTHWPSTDSFWTVVKNGVEQAQKDLGVKVNSRTLDSFDIPQMQNNFDAAIATQPDAIMTVIADPDAIGPKVREARDKGIPVMAMNGGLDTWEKYGALFFIGQEETRAGELAGQRMAEAGVTSALCINHVQGIVTLDQRCEGFDKGLGGNAKQVAVDGSSPTKMENGIVTALRQNPQADGLLTVGQPAAPPAIKALKQSGKGDTVKLATFDVAPEAIQSIMDGEMMFAIDQQGFLQGYNSVANIVNYLLYRVHPIGVVNTGPLFVTKDNAQELLKLSKEGLH